MPRHLKTDLLDQVLLGSEVGSAIVVHANQARRRPLRRASSSARGHAVAALHGDRSQSQRERALESLKRGRVQVLVATDIASRGIDVEDISHVINYDVPHTPEDYVHRIGRTGRVDAVGDAFTLMSPEESKDVQAIERFLGRSIPRVTIPDFDYGRVRADEGRAREDAVDPTTATVLERRGSGERRAWPRPAGTTRARTTRCRDRSAGMGRGHQGRARRAPAGPGCGAGAVQTSGEARRKSAPTEQSIEHGRRRMRNQPERRRRKM